MFVKDSGTNELLTAAPPLTNICPIQQTSQIASPLSSFLNRSANGTWLQSVKYLKKAF